MTSVAIEPLGQLTLTGDWQETPLYVRIDSHTQLHVFADYDPHASEVEGAGECEIQLLYSTQPSDIEMRGSGNFAWSTHVEEQDQGDGSSLFVVRTWRIRAAGVALADRDPNFSRPIPAKVIKCRAREVGVTEYGTLSLSVASQRI